MTVILKAVYGFIFLPQYQLMSGFEYDDSELPNIDAFMYVVSNTCFKCMILLICEG